MAGDEDDKEIDTGVSQLALKVQTVYSRQSDIQDQATWSIRSPAY
jgi:hypothetical protein